MSSTTAEITTAVVETTTPADETTTTAETTTAVAETTTTAAKTTTTAAEKITFAAGWTGPDAVLYWSFDNIGDLVTMEGTSQVNFDPIVPGKVNKALTVDRTKRQWVDLGIHTEACMTRPDTCDAAGGAISLWVRVLACPGIIGGGIVSSISADYKTGFSIACNREGTIFWVDPENGYGGQPLSGWAHVVLNCVGPNNGEGIRGYVNGAEDVHDTDKRGGPYSTGDGRIVVGRH